MKVNEVDGRYEIDLGADGVFSITKENVHWLLPINAAIVEHQNRVETTKYRAETMFRAAGFNEWHDRADDVQAGWIRAAELEWEAERAAL